MGRIPGSCRSLSRRWPTRGSRCAVPTVQFDFTPARYPGYTPFAMAPAFLRTRRATHLREGTSFVPYALREPNHPRWSDRYDRYWMRDPKHIDKHDMTKLFYYHKAWYYQEYSICRPTCVGTMGPNTDVDTDPLAPDRVCGDG